MPRLTNKLTTLDSILESAAYIFWEKGFDALTFKAVAKKVGVSQPAIYSHVENKMDLIRKVLLWSAQVGRQYIDSKLDPRNKALDNLKIYVEANLNFFHEQKMHAHSILALYYFGANNEAIKTLYFDTQIAAMSRISIFLIQAQHENKLQIGCEQQLSFEIHTLLIGFCYRSIYADKKRDQKKIISIAHQAIANLTKPYILV